MNFRKNTLRHLAVVATTASVLVLGACASKGIAPVAELAGARASVSQAEGLGALQLAPVEFLVARDKLAKAETAVREERFAEGRRLAEQVVADAELAERKARAEKAALTVKELERANAALEQEAMRKTRP